MTGQSKNPSFHEICPESLLRIFICDSTIQEKLVVTVHFSLQACLSERSRAVFDLPIIVFNIVAALLQARSQIKLAGLDKQFVGEVVGDFKKSRTRNHNQNHEYGRCSKRVGSL